MRPSRPSSPVRPRTSLLVVAGAVAFSAPGASAAPAAAPVVLDSVPPIAEAASGPTLAWLRRSDARGDHARLVVRDAAGAAPRVVDRALPTRPISLTIGTTASGTAVAVVATAGSTTFRPRPSSQPKQRGALYVVPLDGSAAPRRLRVSTPGADLYRPGLFRGRLTFARLQRTHGEQRWTVRAGTLTSARSRVVARPTGNQVAVDHTTPVDGGGVVYATSTLDPVTSGYRYVLREVRSGGRQRVLSRTAIGGSATVEVGFGPLTVSTAGDRLSAVRGATGLQTWSLRTGRRLSSVPSRTNDGFAVPVGAEGVTEIDPDGTLRLVPRAH